MSTVKKRILCVVGTRPEAIKMAPVIQRLKGCGWAETLVLATAQHRQMLDQVFDVFGITPDVDLNIMRPNQALPELTARLLTAADGVLSEQKPDCILVQGDTTTVMAVALAAFYRRIPVGHVEAGLRTGDLSNPFPEEMNRLLAGRMSKWHFAPTQSAKANLLKEGFDEASIHVTGNTVIDALMDVAARDLPLPIEVAATERVVLVTAHRRENFGLPLEEICRAIYDLAEHYSDVRFIYPVHPNPNVIETVNRKLSGHSRITLCAPLDYLPFVATMKRADVVLTDSGGVQEEAPALGKPVLVMRRETERPEAVTEGVVVLVGPEYSSIVSNVRRLLDDPSAYAAMAKGVSPYGDGHAAERIVTVLENAFRA